MKIVTIVGTRPHFIKAWPVSVVLRGACHEEFFVHTGQHYDYALSKIFFDQLDIPVPDMNLGVGSGTHGRQIGRLLERIEEVLQAFEPDWVIVYGDTNSTLAGALAAAKLQLPVAHIEAGLRSFNRRMPEEQNRVLTDHCSELLLCPTETAVRNLSAEGITEGVHLVGDVMYDALLKGRDIARDTSHIMEELQLQTGKFLLATVHREENTIEERRLRDITLVLHTLARYETVVFPLHPRTHKALETFGLVPRGAMLPFSEGGVRFINPVGYVDMIRLEEEARVILTDSGGIQKEAFWLGTPCVTLRDETEWEETVACGANTLAGTDSGQIIAAAAAANPWRGDVCPFHGGASERILDLLLRCRD